MQGWETVHPVLYNVTQLKLGPSLVLYKEEGKAIDTEAWD